MFFERFLGAVFTAVECNVKRFWPEYVIGLVALGTCGWSLYTYILAPPASFPVGEEIPIPEGSSLPAIAKQLTADHIIQHPLVFEGIVRIFGRRNGVQANVYRFSVPTNVVTIAKRLLAGISGIPSAHITFIEGETAAEMAVQVHNAFPSIAVSDFIDAGQPYEGYLFPDTYEFAPATVATDIVQRMRDNFDAKIASIQPTVDASGHSLSDIVIMASIVEKEARTPEDKRIVAGILWKRIALGQPLQVDAVFGYIEGRSEFSPSFSELFTDSPYNTYRHKGLPPGPISNPGLESLEAAANPEQTSYLYYLTGRDGLMHYAATYAGHLANEVKYLE